MLEGPKTTLRFDDSLRGLVGLVYSQIHSYDLLQGKDTKQAQQRETESGAKPGGNQSQASKGPLPVKSYGTHLIPPAVSCDNTCEMSTKEAHERLSA